MSMGVGERRHLEPIAGETSDLVSWTTMLALAVFSFMTVAGVIARPLLPVDETRYMTVAWEMWHTGNFLVPHLNGEIYSDKPPLLFWLINLSWSVFGFSELAGRLVGPAFGVVSILLTILLGRTMWPRERQTGERAALVLATTLVFAIYASLTMFDALLTAAALLSILAAVKVYRTNGWWWWLVFGAGFGLGGLAKGPVIAVHVMPAVLLMPLWAHGLVRPNLKRWYFGLAVGFALGLSIVSLWLVPALLAGGEEYATAILWKQSAGRMVNAFAHARPSWFYLGFLPLLAWPWLWWPPLWRQLRNSMTLHDPMVRLCLIWAGTAFLFFSAISGKQLHYLVPVLPVVSLLAGRALQGVEARRIQVLAPILPLLLLAVLAFAVFRGYLPVDRFSEQAVRAVFIGAGAGVKLVAAISLLALLLWKAPPWLSIAVLTPLFVGTVYALGADFGHKHYDGTPLAAVLGQRQTAGIAFIGRYQGEFGFLGRLTVPVDRLDDSTALARWVAENPGGTIVGRINRLRPGWRPVILRDYRDGRFGIWIVPPHKAVRSPPASALRRPCVGGAVTQELAPTDELDWGDLDRGSLANIDCRRR